MSAPSRAEVQALDAADPLHPFLDRFDRRDPDRVYVDGNSLGVPPRAAAGRLAAVAESWARELVGGWETWLDEAQRLGDAIGTGLLGAQPGEVVCCDSVTVNLHKLAGAALRDRPGVVLVDPAEFPTDRYVLAALGREVVDCEPTAAAVAQAATMHPVALAVFSLVGYRSGALAALCEVTAAVHAAGGLMLWDLSHAAGSVRIDLAGSGADLAVGCTYKYLAGGPGAPGYLYVRAEHQERLQSPVPGWFGAADQFAMGPAYVPAPGITRWLAGTPSVVAMAAAWPGVELLAEAGMPAVAAKGRSLTSLAVDLHEAWLAPLGFGLATPRDAAARGAHVALRHPDAWQVCRGLIERFQVIPDFRGPDLVRLGFQALTTTHLDVWEACSRLRDLVATGDYRSVDSTRRRVT